MQRKRLRHPPSKAPEPERAPSTPSLPYKPTKLEKIVLQKQAARWKAQPPSPRLKVQTGVSVKTTIDHPDYLIGRDLLSEALGTHDPDFVEGIVSQLQTANTHRLGVDTNKLNFMLSVIKGINPTDQVETMLGAQMSVVHLAIMRYSLQFNLVEELPQLDSLDRTLNKLIRTFIQLVDGLKRYRTGGEQKVTVQHVSVNQGGQAIVGHVTHAKPKSRAGQIAEAEPLALTDTRQVPMPILDEQAKELAVAQSIRKNAEQS
ncbi:MAG: hypothetical protein KGK33_07195 [Hyphomicrobiales bacterium]|nr:hypothetical protein [Hyphomicrobiales bacterium]